MEKKVTKSGKRKTGDKSVPEKPLDILNVLRKNIDNIDQEILELLLKRQVEVEKIVSLKKTNGITVYHPAREEDIITDRRHQGKEMGMDPDYLEGLVPH
jgi:chorismate mutase/prephenate dehydrogenase